MANSDKNILITPNRGAAADPKIDFIGANASVGPQTITMSVYPDSNGTLSWEGSAGQLFSITNDLTGTIFSVNDVSGIPSLEINANGTVKIAEFSGNVGIGLSSPTEKLDVSGNVKATTFIGNLSGNAATATTLQTARTIGGVSFNGSANINLPGVNTAGNQNTTGSAATLTTARTINGVSFNGSANITLPTVNTSGDQSIAGLKTFNGRIGIKSAPSAASELHIDSPGTFGIQLENSAGGTAFQLSSTGSSYASGGDRFVITKNSNSGVSMFTIVSSTGNVGIGTNTPDAKLTVNGAASFAAGTAALPSIARSGDLNTGFWFPAADTIAASTAGGERLRITSAGDVGIGTSSPGVKLDVVGAGIVSPTGTGSSNIVALFRDTSAGAQNVGAGIGFAGNDGVNTGVTFATINGRKENATSGNFASYLAFQTRAAAGNLTERLRITSAGNVGIGTTAPSAKLHVNQGGIRAEGVDFASGAYIQFLNTANGNATPDYIGQRSFSGGNRGLALGDGTTDNLFVKTSNGNVGIGTTSPSAKLHVDGTVLVSSTNNLTVRSITTGAAATSGTITGTWTLTAGSKLQATYADLAEYYEADIIYPPGTVLEFGGDKEVTIAKEETSRLAGVVSTNPAYVMNNNCPGNKVAIALQGRCPVKVKGSVYKGDMIVSAGNGYAKAVSIVPTIGTVLGKSLENFNGTEGIIEIAVGRL